MQYLFLTASLLALPTPGLLSGCVSCLTGPVAKSVEDAGQNTIEVMPKSSQVYSDLSNAFILHQSKAKKAAELAYKMLTIEQKTVTNKDKVIKSETKRMTDQLMAEEKKKLTTQ